MIGLAQVTGVHPQRRTLELVDLRDGGRVGEAQVSSGIVGSDSGAWTVPSVARPATEQQAGGIAPTGRSLIAVYAKLHGRPVVLGFLPPLGSQMTFSEQDRAIYRHPSGGYATFAPDGSIEVRHPGGAYLRIGNGPGQDLSAVAANGWTPPAGGPATVTLLTGGVTLTIAPTGLVTLTSAETVINGNVTINGNATVNGALTVTEDATINGISFIGHRHPGIMPGAGTTGTPV